MEITNPMMFVMKADVVEEVYVPVNNLLTFLEEGHKILLVTVT